MLVLLFAVSAVSANEMINETDTLMISENDDLMGGNAYTAITWAQNEVELGQNIQVTTILYPDDYAKNTPYNLDYNIVDKYGNIKQFKNNIQGNTLDRGGRYISADFATGGLDAGKYSIQLVDHRTGKVVSSASTNIVYKNTNAQQQYTPQEPDAPQEPDTPYQPIPQKPTIPKQPVIHNYSVEIKNITYNVKMVEL